MITTSMTPTTAVSYLVSGGTGATGAARLAQEQAMYVDPHIYLGLSLSEVALLMGIVGTLATIAFQYLNYKNIKRKCDAGDDNETK